MKRIFASDDGKELLEYLTEIAMYDFGTFKSDPYQILYQEGRRSVISGILGMIQMSDLQYLKTFKDEQIKMYGE